MFQLISSSTSAPIRNVCQASKEDDVQVQTPRTSQQPIVVELLKREMLTARLARVVGSNASLWHGPARLLSVRTFLLVGLLLFFKFDFTVSVTAL